MNINNEITNSITVNESKSISNKDCNKLETINKKYFFQNFCAILALTQVNIYGLILFASGLLDMPQKLTSIMLVYLVASISNMMITLLKLECCISFFTANVMFIIGSIFKLYFDHNNMTNFYTDISVFSIYGFAIGIIMNVVPVYISMTAHGNTKIMLLNAIGGLGVVGGLFIANNFYYYFNDVKFLLILIIFECSILGLLFISICKRCKINGKLEIKYFKELFTTGINSTILLIIAMIANNLSGILYPIVEKQNIFGRNNQLTYDNLSNVIAMLCTVLAYYVNNGALGRKSALILSSIGCFITNILFAILNIQYHKFICILFIIVYNIGLGCIPFILIGEIVPLKVIQEGSFIGSFANWLGGAFASKTFIPNSNMNFIWSNVILIILIVYFVLFFTETKYQKESKYQPFK
ncbi:hypothetical protein EBI_24636 [Enterocytozoon bieneusi H348]|nr:hypothetical protein EBI_24636 [Enterocytozoon bieneusi H348]|eukprot:XP_002650428.1 hypothetical protein EBI_24636 [Enterocytozoon bieneusi H348]